MATTKATTLAHTLASTTSSTAEFDKLDGLTATTDELNLVDGSVSGPLSHRNMIINGAMQVAQRGTSTSVDNSGYTFSPDRFSARASIGSSHTLSQDTDAPDGFTNSLKFTVGTGATPTGTDYARLLYKFEGYEAVRLQYGQSTAKTITLSFWVKSSVAGTFGVGLKHTTARNIMGSYTVSQANTWEYVSVSLVGDTATAITNETNGEALSLGFDLGEGPDRSSSTGSWAGTSYTQYGLSGGTKIISTSSATWQITGVQLELGSVATPFEHRSYGDELRRCERYYEKIGNYIGLSNSTPTVTDGISSFRTTKRTSTYTIGFSSGTNLLAHPTITGVSVTNSTATQRYINYVYLNFSHSSTGNGNQLITLYQASNNLYCDDEL